MNPLFGWWGWVILALIVLGLALIARAVSMNTAAGFEDDSFVTMIVVGFIGGVLALAGIALGLILFFGAPGNRG